MNTITLQVTFNDMDYKIFEPLFKKFKVKTTIIEKREEDDTKMTKEAYFAMIEEARKGKEIQMSREEK